MLTLNDGRAELWQWDTGRTLSVDADCSQVHFSNKVFGRSIDVDVADGVATIPDILLQTDKDLNVWAFVGTAENGYTKISKTFKVNRRNKPADYVFTPIEQTTIAEIAAIAQSVRDDADAGVFDGEQGPIGPAGADGKTPEYGVDYGTPEQIAGIAQSAAEILKPELSQIKGDLTNKLPKSPADWEAWTTEEQAAARERMGIVDYELIEEITIDTDDITSIVRNVDMNGNPYYFAKLWVICECPKQSQNVSVTFGNGTHVAPVVDIANTSGDCSTNVEIDCTSGYLVYRYVSRVMYNWIAQPVYQTRPVLQMPASIRLVIQSPSIGNIPNGAKFKIYGVRK